MASTQEALLEDPRSPDLSSASQHPPSSSSSLKHDPRRRPPLSASTTALSATRRSSNMSIASASSSVGTVLDSSAPPDSSTLNDVSPNSISSLLSHPIVRTGLVPQSALSVPSTHRAPSARDIPPVTLTPIPHVESSTFKSYLSNAGALYESYRRSRLAAEEPSATPFQRTDKDAAKGDYFDTQVRSPTAASPTTPTSKQQGLTSPTSPTLLRKMSSASATPRRDKSAPTPLSTIPTVYFDDNFQLANPRTFDIVSERSDVIPPDPQTSRDDPKDTGVARSQNKTRRKALHTNAILQEKLSWYMDTVEVHLISSIATASSSFFAALGSLKDLQSEATESISKIKSLRGALHQLDEEMALGGLEILTMRRRRENLRKLSNAVGQLCEVIEEAKHCESLVDNGDLANADLRINALEDMISGTAADRSNETLSPRVDLRQLKALDGVADGIAQLRQRISRGFENRFIDALLSDLRVHVDSVPPRDTIQRWSNASLRARGDHNRGKTTAPAYLSTNEQLRPELMKALEGLARAGHTTRAATAYREAIMREIKSMVRRHLPSSNDDDAESVTSLSTSLSTRGGRRLNQQEKSSILARNLRALDPEGAEELLVKVYTSVGEALRRLGVQVKVVLDVTSSLDQPTIFPHRSSSLTPSSDPSQIREEVTQALDMSNLLGQAVDVIQTQVTKVLKVRNEQNTRLPLQQFLRYFTLNRLFTDECEAVSSRGGEALKEVVNAQVKEFLQLYADVERQRIVQILEADKWDVKDFGPTESSVLDRVLESMNRTPQAWIENARVSEEPPSPSHANGTTIAVGLDDSNSTSATKAPVTKTRSATIDGQSYFLVQSTLSALCSIDSFLNLAAVIPSLTVDCSLKLLEHLKAFNSRCCQLILGAGATKSAGLKNITSKHLALASQACSFLVALIPYIREFVRRQTGGNVGNAFVEFDKVKRLLQDHQSSIHEKLVDIMSQRSVVHANSMKKINWDAPEKEPAISPYMESLTKETGTLHRVLSRHVPGTDVQMIMTPIFAHYSQEWSKAFREASVRTESGKARMLRDAEYLDSRFSKIEGSGELGPNLIQLVKDKQIQSKPAEPESKRQSVDAKAALPKEPVKEAEPQVAVDAPNISVNTQESTSQVESKEEGVKPPDAEAAVHEASEATADPVAIEEPVILKTVTEEAKGEEIKDKEDNAKEEEVKDTEPVEEVETVAPDVEVEAKYEQQPHTEVNGTTV